MTAALPSTAVRAFACILGRDLAVTGKELGSTLAQTLVQPVFLIFVFAKVLGELGYITGEFREVFLPGLISLNVFLVSLQAVAFPLVADLSGAREIEDRLLAPLPTYLVALEKIVFGSLRGLLGSLPVFPVGLLILDGFAWEPAGLPTAILVLVLGALAGGAAGLVVGTAVPPARINFFFGAAVTPLIFTGSIQFPLLGIDQLRWFQIICAFNPMTYISEGLRSALTPSVLHLPAWACILALTLLLSVLGVFGIRGFDRRAID